MNPRLRRAPRGRRRIPAHARARALDALGRYEEAILYYRRFVTRWQDADPHLQPQVEAACERIRELEEQVG